jgi:predicted heme/steroid binding protein
MAKISTYEEVLLPKLEDELIGTSVGGSPANVTFNFSLQQLLDLFVPNIPSNNLQGVLDLGNTATQDINLTGTINTVTLNATGNTLLKNTYLNGPVRISGPLSDVYNTAGTNGQVLSTTGSSIKWITLPTYVALTATAPIIYNSGTGNLSITQSSSVTNGYLSSANWSTFNQKQSAISLTTIGSSGASTFLFDTLNIPNYTLSGLGGVPTSRTLTINGVTYDLSSNRSWTISGGIASVTATSPAFSSGGANPNITIQASGATQDGYLSSSDWTIFNGKQNALGFTPENVSNKVTSISAASTNIEYPSAKLLYDSLIGLGGVSAVTATSPVSSSGGSTPDISISQSGVSTSGYLSTTDWNTFNNKQDSGSYITSLTGEATATGPGAASVTLGNSAVIGKVLTGLSTSTGGSIVATDSILTAFGKVQNQITGIVGGVTYQGVWDAATNVPPLTSSVGTQGYYYVVNVAGSTNLNGITDWKVGDWAIFNGTAWNKVDNTDSVSSVNGQTGAVSLTTDNVPEGIINLYYLDSRARAALSFAAGSGAYNSTSGVITIPTNTSQLTNGAAFITLGSLTASSPLSYNNTTGAFSISQASASVNGYLSSTDWTTFNSKGSGTVTSVGLSMPSAFSVGSSPVTGAGTIAVTGAGSTLQYIDGTGALQTFPTIITEAQNLITEVYNETGATLTKGTVVYINGGHGNLPTVTKAIATSDATSAQTYGVIQLDITDNNNGHAVVIGSLGNLNTFAYAPGTALYLSSTTAGQWTDIKQYAPAHLVYVGIVVRQHPTQGIVEVRIQNGFEMDELHNVSAQSPSNNSILQYVSSTSLWTAVAGSTTNISEGTNLYYTDARARSAVSLTTTGSSGASTYSSLTGVLNVPTYTLSGLGGVPTSRQLTINGTAYDLSADRSWSVGTVTSVAALTIGTTGTDLSSTVATGTTTPIITLNVPDASASNRGVVTTGTQTFAGAKTFSSDITVNTVKVGLGGGSQGQNVAVGGSALGSNTTGNDNTAVGNYALGTNTVGWNNVAVGFRALNSNLGGSYNVALGQDTLYNNSSGSSNLGIGYAALTSNTTGSNNAAFGPNALYNITTASYNSAVGDSAGAFITGGATANQTSSNSLYLGAFTRASANANTNEIVIGYATTGNGSNTVTIGNSSITANYFTGSVNGGSFVKSGGTSAEILAGDGSIISAGTNVTISGGTISATGGSSTPPVGNTLYLYNYWGGFLNY